MEIPQYGIIRSLNVHVSGSILLWEYISLSVLGTVFVTLVHEAEHVAVNWGDRRVCLKQESGLQKPDRF